MTLSVDQVEVSLEDELLLSVSIEADQSTSDPVFPSMAAFKSVPRGTSSSIQIINGNMRFKKEYSFALIPQNEGSHTLGPVSVFSGGKEYQSNTVEVHIARDPYSVPAEPVPDPNALPTTEPKGEAKAAKSTWIETTVSKNQPYVSEQILFTFRFYTSVNVGQATLSLPEFKDFWTDEVVPEKKYYREIDGIKHVVSEKVVALYPLRSGNLEVGETLLEVEVPQEREKGPFDGPFFGLSRRSMRKKNLRAPPLTVVAKALPDGRPDNFTNLVGRFDLKIALADDEIKLGESTTLTIEISGEGNIKDAVLPKSIEFPGMKTYDDKPTLEIVRRETGISGKKVFKRALVPIKDGSLTLPPIVLSVFDPAKEVYETLEGPSLALNVLPSADQSLGLVGPQGATGEQGRQLAPGQEDIATIHVDLKFKPRRDREKTMDLVFYGGFVFLPFLSLLTLVFRRRKEARLKNLSAIREREALGNFKKGLSRLTHSKGDSSNPTEKILDVLKNYVGSRFNLFGGALTTEEIVGRLNRSGVGRDITDKFRALLFDLEKSRYGGGPHEVSWESWIKQGLYLVSQIDKKLNRRKKESPPLTPAMLWFLVFLLPISTMADPFDLQTITKRAADAYFENRLEEAREYYEQISQQGFWSADLYYNRGNVAYRLGNPGEALVYYEKALRLNPRDADIRANLSFVGEKVRAGTGGVSFPERLLRGTFFWTSYLTWGEALWILNGLSALFWGSLWLTFFMRRSWLKKWAAFGGVVLVVFGASVWVKYTTEVGARLAVVLEREIDVHPTFLEREKKMTKLVEGSRIRILSEQVLEGDRWLMIRLPTGQKGWITAKGIEII